MKKWVSAVVAVALSLALVIGIACGEEEEEEVKELKYGVGTTFIGMVGAVAGLPHRYAKELATERIGEFEVGGERYVLDYIFEENNFDIAGGRTSTTRLIYDHGVKFMRQAGADPAIAAREITEEEGVILFWGAGSLFDLGPDYPHTFMDILCYDLETPPLFDWLSQEHPEVKTVVMTHTEDRMGQVILVAAETACDYYGLELHTEAVTYATVEYYPIATKLMTYDPDLVIGGLDLFRAMWDMGYEGPCAVSYWVEAALGAVPWDKAAGNVILYQPQVVGDIWPEVAAFVDEYEASYGLDATPSVFQGALTPYVFVEVLKQAGTVDDVDKIIETMETGTFDSPIGPVYFGGEALNGIGHALVYPAPILEVVGPGEYQLLKLYSPEEVEAIAAEIYLGR